MVTGMGVPFSIFCVWALNALQNSMMLSPRWPSAGPIGGDGLALPAGTCSLMIPTIFFAIYVSKSHRRPPASHLLNLRILQLEWRRTPKDRQCELDDRFLHF